MDMIIISPTAKAVGNLRSLLHWINLNYDKIKLIILTRKDHLWQMDQESPVV
jgi:hypothetical protein